MSFENFKQIVLARITQHKQAEAAKLEAQRESIRLEEERKATVKAQAEAEAILAIERAKQAAEEAKARAVLIDKDEADAKAKRSHANRAEILEVLSENFGLPEEMMLEWILEEFAGDIQFNNRKAT